MFEGKGNEQRRERMWGGGGETGGREYLSESLTDYLHTYTLTSVVICFACFAFGGCGATCISEGGF